MEKTLKKLDSLVDEIRDLAFQKSDAKQTVSLLLQAARSLIEISENLNEVVPPTSEIALPLLADDFADHSIITKKIRFQEDHINPAIQQKFSQSLYQIRRTRDRVFAEPDLFGDPAWDMMLDLSLAERDHKSVSVTSACMASCVPPTTALRWVSVLETKGLIERSQDELDGRRRYVNLSTKGRVKMNRFFAQLVRNRLM